MRILGVNGIWKRAGSMDSFTDQLLLRLAERGHETVHVRYPLLTAILGPEAAWWPWARKRRARDILAAHRPGDAIIAYSAGVLLTLIAMEMGARFSVVFFFAGAAEADVEIPAGAAERIYNIYSPADDTLLLGSLIPWHPFGALGRIGYIGMARNIMNVRAHECSHAEYARPGRLAHWARFVHERIAPTVSEAA